MARQVLVIAGPPCSGKTTLALELAQPGELVIDRDLIARELGSDRSHMHDKVITAEAEKRMRLALSRLATATGDVWAYVVRCAPTADERERLRARFDAAVRVVDPGMDECLRRAARDKRPPGTFASIRRWYERYTTVPTKQRVVVRQPCMDCGTPTTGARCNTCCERARSGRPWRTLCAQVLREENTCWVCGLYVDQHLDKGHRLSATVDHVMQLRDGGPPLDRDNVRLAHRSCNTTRANQLRAQRAGRRIPITVDPHSV